MHPIDLLLTLTGALAAALALGYLTHRIGLSPIVGYLLAGLFVGPHSPGFDVNQTLADELASLGVILLMFSVGLNFHFKELLSVRKIAIPGAIAQSLLATGLGMWVGHAFGWPWGAGLVFGLAISVASTVVLTRVLMDNHELHTPTGHIAIGWLVVEDLFTVLVLVILPSLFGADQQLLHGRLGLEVIFAVLKMAGVVLFIGVGGGYAIPRLLKYVALTGSRELFTLAILIVSLGIAVSSAILFDTSIALGAFLAGMVVGRSEFSVRAASEALTMRDAFCVLFFVSIGMLLDPLFVLERPGLVLATLAVVVIGKPFAAFTIVILLRYPVRVALAVSAALAQIGEFSFILAAMGRELGILSYDALQAIVAASIASIILCPFFYRLVNPAEQFLKRFPVLGSWLSTHSKGKLADLPESRYPGFNARRAVVVGYGPVGQAMVTILKDNRIVPTIIELNLNTIEALHQSGLQAVYGDATHEDTLKAAQVEHSTHLILTCSDIHSGPEIVRAVRVLNPNIIILARASFLNDGQALRRAGAQHVFTAELEMALALMEAMLAEFGASAEQIERERRRIREKFQPVSA
ncbi:MAG TPA: cation:proton antiporter [Opitutales bacterium]|nr:cation:proton antiporter [Opitutales bacterium]